jgi:hypothetical protein
MRKFSSTAVLEFKKDLNDIELKGIEAVIDHNFDFGHTAFGLAYTSTSGYAMYNVLEPMYYDEFEVMHFAITTGDNGTLVMVCFDHAEDGEIYVHNYGFEYDDIFPGDDE